MKMYKWGNVYVHVWVKIIPESQDTNKMYYGHVTILFYINTTDCRLHEHTLYYMVWCEVVIRVEFDMSECGQLRL